MGWSKIGTGANSIAIYANRLVALTPDRKRIFMRDPSSFQWEQIGGPAKSIIGGAWDLYAETPDGKHVNRYDGKNWTAIGESGLQLVGIGNALYKLEHKTRNVYRFNRYNNEWSKIGGAAHSIIEGGSKIYASTTDRKEIYEYSRYKDSWTKIGTGGHSWVGVGGTIYGLTPNKKEIYRYEGETNNWSKIGGPADKLIGGGSFLYAIDPETKDVLKYSGKGTKWTKIGTPGYSFAASGNRLYGLTPNRKELYKYESENAESERLRKLCYKIQEYQIYGNRIMRGFLVKELGGKIIAENNADVCYQPLSTLKILPYFHAVYEIDKKQSGLESTQVNWYGLKIGTADAVKNVNCLQKSHINAQLGSAPLEHALPTMMWFSHNRTLDAVMEHYGIINITQRAQDLGLSQTEMYYGCEHSDIPVRTWPSNLSTLNDLAKLFEGVENLDFIKSDLAREIWRSNMIQIDATNTISYTSKITGDSIGPLDFPNLRALITEIAGVSKHQIVSEFLESVTIRGKGGSGGPDPNEVGGCDFIELSLPFKVGSETKIKKYLLGWYIYQRRAAIKSILEKENAPLNEFKKEMFRVPVTKALATW